MVAVGNKQSTQGFGSFNRLNGANTRRATRFRQERSGQSPSEFLKRHMQLEQGDLCDEDHELNGEAVKDGSRILSAFKTTTGVKLWVITEAKNGDGHRSATTLLLPEEY